jgi:hypothetical protein
MATNFPTSIDSFTNPSSGDTLDSPSHAAQHTNINDAMVAVQTRLGTGSGTIGATTSYTPALTNFTVSSQSVQYAAVNNLVFVRFYFAISSVTGAPIFTVPSGLNISGFAQHQTCNLLDVGVANYQGVLMFVSSTSVAVECTNVSFTYAVNSGVSASTPFTWTAGDVISGGFWYLAV